MVKIDLNCDLGESFGAWAMGHDEAVIGWITSANVACGFHAGDPRVMARTVRLACQRGVAVGAHPSFPDLVGFGRRTLDVTPVEVETDVIYQIGALQAFCAAEGTRLRHVKPHGQLYNVAVKDETLAQAIARAVRKVDPALILVAPGGALKRAGEQAGLRVAIEAFADRAYLPDGSLAPRSMPGAVITDPQEVARRAVEMVLDHRVKTMTGEHLTIVPHTLCIHGDTPGADQLAATIHQALVDAGATICALSEVL
jgi:UPF0271 protein